MFPGRIPLVCPCNGVSKRKSPPDSFLLLQKRPAYLARFTWMACEIGNNYSCSLCFLGRCFQNCSKQHAAFRCSSHQAFSLRISLESKWCNHTVVRTQLQFERNPFLFYRRDQISIWSTVGQQQTMRFLCICWHRFFEILVPRNVNWFTDFRGFTFIEMVPFCLKHELCFIWVHEEVNASLPAPGYAAGIWLGGCICEKS